MKKLSYINQQFKLKLVKDANNSIAQIDVNIGFNYADCSDNVDKHIGSFDFSITNPSNSTFDLNSVANFLQNLQKMPNTSNNLLLQTTFNPSNSQDLNKIKSFLELLIQSEDCASVPSTQELIAAGLETIGQNWGTIPNDQSEADLASTDLNAYLTLKLSSKSDVEVFDLYVEICNLLASHNALSAPHPKSFSDYNLATVRADVISDIVSLISPIVNN